MYSLLGGTSSCVMHDDQLSVRPSIAVSEEIGLYKLTFEFTWKMLAQAVKRHRQMVPLSWSRVEMLSICDETLCISFNRSICFYASLYCCLCAKISTLC